MGRIDADKACPKCGGVAWYETPDGHSVHLRCTCGLCQLVYDDRQARAGKGVTIHNTPKREIVLPQKGTKISRTLGIVGQWYPKEVNTRTIAEQRGATTTEIGQQMMVLRHRGLVTQLQEGRGKPGGSIWKLTKEGARRLGV